MDIATGKQVTFFLSFFTFISGPLPCSTCTMMSAQLNLVLNFFLTGSHVSSSSSATLTSSATSLLSSRVSSSAEEKTKTVIFFLSTSV